jgi:hypothetical protein
MIPSPRHEGINVSQKTLPRDLLGLSRTPHPSATIVFSLRIAVHETHHSERTAHKKSSIPTRAYFGPTLARLEAPTMSAACRFAEVCTHRKPPYRILCNGTLCPGRATSESHSTGEAATVSLVRFQLSQDPRYRGRCRRGRASRAQVQL